MILDMKGHKVPQRQPPQLYDGYLDDPESQALFDLAENGDTQDLEEAIDEY